MNERSSATEISGAPFAGRKFHSRSCAEPIRGFRFDEAFQEMRGILRGAPFLFFAGQIFSGVTRTAWTNRDQLFVRGAQRFEIAAAASVAGPSREFAGANLIRHAGDPVACFR